MNIFLLHIFLSNHFGITTTKMQSIHKMKNTKTQNLLSKISATVSSISVPLRMAQSWPWDSQIAVKKKKSAIKMRKKL